MKSKLLKGIVLIFIANIINMVFSILTNLLLPKYLSVESYADIKTFQLCLTYIGILHFGFSDGMYLKYGGKNLDEIDRDDLNTNINTIQFFQFVVLIIGIVVGLILHTSMVLYAALALLPYNMMNYYKYLFQASGEFKTYGRVLNVATAGIFLVNIVFLFVVKQDASIYYIIGYVILYYLIWGLLFLKTKKKMVFKLSVSSFSWFELKENIKQGILLMLGNFSSTFITSMDRWFVKALLDTMAFAQYSFSVSMENFLNVAITPLTTTLYNFFCKDNSTETVSIVRKKIVVFACGLITAAFPVKFILQIYLTKYEDATNVLFLLFASQVFYVVNKSVYNNLYKAKKLQSKYFKNLLIAIIVAFIFNIIGYYVLHAKEGFAWGTLFSSVVWLVIVTLDFKDYRCEIDEIIMMIIMVSSFLILGNTVNAVLGFGIFAGIFFVAAFTIMRVTTISLMHNVSGFIKKKRNRGISDD